MDVSAKSKGAIGSRRLVDAFDFVSVSTVHNRRHDYGQWVITYSSISCFFGSVVAYVSACDPHRIERSPNGSLCPVQWA